jgi:hypothetical protein
MVRAGRLVGLVKVFCLYPGSHSMVQAYTYIGLWAQKTAGLVRGHSPLLAHLHLPVPYPPPAHITILRSLTQTYHGIHDENKDVGISSLRSMWINAGNAPGLHE